jgi:RNA polymerase sigma-70 factor (ECF subfamily)
MGTPTMDSEADEIVAQVLLGKIDAFEKIIELYERDVRRVVGALLQNRGTTVDLIQEVFVNAYFHLDRFRRGEDFGVWLRSIARNLVRKELRTRSRETRRLQVYRDQLARRLSSDLAEERRLGLIAEAHKKCREQLPAHAAEVLDLRYDRALSMEEIASRLGRSLEAIKQLLYRARLLLRGCMENRMAQG